MSAPKKVKLVGHKCLKLSSMLHPALSFILPDLSMYFSRQNILNQSEQSKWQVRTLENDVKAKGTDSALEVNCQVGLCNKAKLVQ